MKADAVTASYRRWAPVYDATFGRITSKGRTRAAAHVTARGGKVLEVGVGTGLVLPMYGPRVQVTGIDFSAEMLAKAQQKVDELNLSHVASLRQMDARKLDFPDASFDSVAAMHVLSVVPEPEKVVAEMARVCRPGGQVVIVNHFSASGGLALTMERAMRPLENMLGWQTDFPIEKALGSDRLREIQRDRLPPFGLMTWLVLERV